MENNIKPKVLYLSYDGILEPLGQSQVLNYLIQLSSSFSIELLTFEKQSDINNQISFNRISKICKDNNIEWSYTVFSRSKIFSKFNALKYIFFVAFLILRKPIKLIHCRSYFPTLAAYFISLFSSVSYIYDMRGYWIEEKIDVGKINKSGIIAKFFNFFDSKMIKNAAHIVTLSEVSQLHLSSKFNIDSTKISTIYTCTDLVKFKLRPLNLTKKIVFGYVGTTVGWYLFDDTLNFIKLLLDSNTSFYFKLVTLDNHDLIIKRLKSKEIDLNRVILKKSEFNNIHLEYMDIDYAVFFIKESYSKTASMPTKFGEFLASGIPCIINRNIGDTHKLVGKYPFCGQVVNALDKEAYLDVIDNSNFIALSQKSMNECREIAYKYFSLDKGSKSYLTLYNRILFKNG